MWYSFKKINIEAPFPTTACGHSCQRVLLSECKDHLYARVTAFKDDDLWLVHYSLDLLAFDTDHRDQLEKALRDYYQFDRLIVITSATHTHYANSVRDERYQKYLCDLLITETVKMEYREMDDISVSYRYVHSTAVGKSRISGYESGNEILALLSFYSGQSNFLNVITYNCHPTILEAHTPYFSSEYPGHVLKKLEEKYPRTDHTFLQGAAGDISSRFTRSGQTYADMTELAERLVSEIEKLMDKPAEIEPLKLSYKAVPVEFRHEFTPIDLSRVRSDLSEREKETIRIGQEERAKMEKAASEIFGQPSENNYICAMDTGPVRLIFFPNEIFSAYIDYIDIDKEVLVSYSNGYGPYVLPIGFPYITYEMFTDTLSTDSKSRIIEILRTI